MDDPTDAAWSALLRHLERRAASLCAAVRSYPGPIAHCDEQLPQLIAERNAAVMLAARAAAVDAGGGVVDEDRATRIDRFVVSLDAAGDGALESLRNACLAAGDRATIA